MFDNATDPDFLDPYSASAPATSSSPRGARTGAKPPARSSWTCCPEEAVALLLGGAPADEVARQEAAALATELGRLPLALAQARAYMRETGESFGGYRELLQTSALELLAEGRAHPKYPEPVARTWDVSVRAAERQCPAARALLKLLAFLAPETLPRAVFDAKPDVLPEGLRGKLARNRAIAALTRFSLIRAEAGSINVHRLVQALTRDAMHEADAGMQAGFALRIAWSAFRLPIKGENQLAFVQRCASAFGCSTG